MTPRPAISSDELNGKRPAEDERGVLPVGIT
jgi:hypothetical protein